MADIEIAKVAAVKDAASNRQIDETIGKFKTLSGNVSNQTLDITGMNTLLTELHDDHATFKTAADGVEILIEELHDDHAGFRTSCTSLKTLADELKANIATVRTLINELKADHNALLVKLDADAGVTDANYASLHTTAAANVAAIAAANATAPPAALTASKPSSAPAALTAAIVTLRTT